jgi:hypothetical protein
MDVIRGGSLKDVITVESALKKRFRDSPEFTKARHKLHTSKFYSFLRFAGERAVVLVVKGDHDDDFPGDYQSSRINRIGGCQEISGKTARIEDLTFLGLGYDQAGFRIPLREFIRQYQGAVDIIITHPPQKNVPIVAELRPRLLIRGHSGGGSYLVNGVPTVFTACGHALIDISSSGLPTVLSTARFSESFLLEKYDWLAPYPTKPKAPL